MHWVHLLSNYDKMPLKFATAPGNITKCLILYVQQSKTKMCLNYHEIKRMKDVTKEISGFGHGL